MSFIRKCRLDKQIIDIFAPPLIVGNPSNTNKQKVLVGNLGFLTSTLEIEIRLAPRGQKGQFVLFRGQILTIGWIMILFSLWGDSPIRNLCPIKKGSPKRGRPQITFANEPDFSRLPDKCLVRTSGLRWSAGLNGERKSGKKAGFGNCGVWGGEVVEILRKAWPKSSVELFCVPWD